MARRRNNSNFVRAELEIGVGGEWTLPWKHAQVLRDVTLLTRRTWLYKLQEMELELRSVGIATYLSYSGRERTA